MGAAGLSATAPALLPPRVGWCAQADCRRGRWGRAAEPPKAGCRSPAARRPAPRVEAERAEHVPGGKRAEVVVAGVAVGRGVVEGERAADRLLRAVGAPRPVVEPGRLQGRLVAEQRVVGVGAAGAPVQLAQEVVEPGGRLGPPAHLAEEAGGVLGHHPGVLVGVALDEAAAFEVVVGAGKAPLA